MPAPKSPKPASRLTPGTQAQPVNTEDANTTMSLGEAEPADLSAPVKINLPLTKNQEEVLAALVRHDASRTAESTERKWRSGQEWYLDTRCNFPSGLKAKFRVGNQEAIEAREAFLGARERALNGSDPVVLPGMEVAQARIQALEDRIRDEAGNLSGFRRNEAVYLALTDAEREELTRLRNYVAAPILQETLEQVERWLSSYGTKTQSEMREVVRAALAEVRG